MNDENSGQEVPIAWTAIFQDTRVYLADGTDAGVVDEVLGAEDIFHGMVVRTGPLATDKMVPAERVATITNQRIVIDMSAEELRALPPFQQEETFRLGIVGLFRKHLGWVEGKDEPG